MEFISISLDTNKEAWKKKMKQLKMHGYQYIVTGDQFATMMNIKGIPHFLLYSKDGTLMQYKADRPSSGDKIRNVLLPCMFIKFVFFLKKKGSQGNLFSHQCD